MYIEVLNTLENYISLFKTNCRSKSEMNMFFKLFELAIVFIQFVLGVHVSKPYLVQK